VKEEAGCDITINGIFYLRLTNGFLDNHLSIFYGAKIAGEEILKQSPDEHSLEVKWFTREEALRLPSRSKLRDILMHYDRNVMIPPDNFSIT
jgi:hypothetical protein